MSVRVTERLIGDAVMVPALHNSPVMIVQSIDEEAKLVKTIWFSDDRKCQKGMFPASAIDRVENIQTPKAAAKTAKPPKQPAKLPKAAKENKPAARRGRPPKK